MLRTYNLLLYCTHPSAELVMMNISPNCNDVYISFVYNQGFHLDQNFTSYR